MRFSMWVSRSFPADMSLPAWSPAISVNGTGPEPETGGSPEIVGQRSGRRTPAATATLPIMGLSCWPAHGGRLDESMMIVNTCGWIPTAIRPPGLPARHSEWAAGFEGPA